MKNKILILGITLLLFSCKTTYVSTITGIEDNAHVKVVMANGSKNSINMPLTLVIDDQEYLISKIYTDKKSMKSETTNIKPGKHQILIKEGNKILFDKSVFISNQETRKIILE